MAREPRDRAPILRVIEGDAAAQSGAEARPQARDLDWSILMARAQDGDRAAYRRLLDEMAPYLRALASRRHRNPQDVEDAVQDILLTVHAIRHTFDPARPFGPWLVAIANRRLADRLRRQTRIRARETPLEAEHEAFAAPRTHFEEGADLRSLDGAVRRLPPMQRQAIRLLKLEEKSLKEASALSGVSVASLKVAAHRALKSLRKIFEERNET